MGIRQRTLENLVTEAFRGKRVFVTGHTGFKGGWLSLALVRLGATVGGYALPPPSGPSLYESAKVASVVENLAGDIRDRDQLDTSMRAFAPDLIFHLAAQALVRRSYADPIETYTTNVLGTAYLLEAARKVPSVAAVIVVTSDKCYANHEWPWAYRETDALGGQDPYSSSKACVELLTASYRKAFFSDRTNNRRGTTVATVRAGNVIGGGDWSDDRLVPDLVRGFLQHALVPLRHPSAVRPWQHVLEPIAGYLSLAECLLSRRTEFADAWNFGPAECDCWPVGRLASEVALRWGAGALWHQAADSNVHEAHTLRLDSGKAHDELGWRPQLKLEWAVAWTVDWYKAWQAGMEMQAFTLAQIAEHQRMASGNEKSMINMKSFA